ncbi:unnamed protein product [Penicillium bialowiezense]
MLTALCSTNSNDGPMIGARFEITIRRKWKIKRDFTGPQRSHSTRLSECQNFGSEEMRNTHGIGADVFRSEKRAGELPRGARAPVPGSRRALVGWLVSAGEPPALEQSATFD